MQTRKTEKTWTALVAKVEGKLGDKCNFEKWDF